MSSSPSSRPRRPSPLPTGARAREPPSPGLLARTLPSTATLNALPTLSRVGSDLQIAATTPMPYPFTTETVHWSIPPTMSDQAEWTIVPTILSGRSIDIIKCVLSIESEPEYRDVVLDYPFVEDHVWSSGENKLGKIWTVQPRKRPVLESSQFERGRAYRIPDPEDRQELLDYYSDVFKLECEIQKCAFVWEKTTVASESERNLKRHGKIIVAKWPLKAIGSAVDAGVTENVADVRKMD